MSSRSEVDESTVTLGAHRARAAARSAAPAESVAAALATLKAAQNPLVIVGKGMAWARAEDEVREFIERTQIPFLATPMGKGVMPDDHPLSVAAARTLALQGADVDHAARRAPQLDPPLRHAAALSARRAR